MKLFTITFIALALASCSGPTYSPEKYLTTNEKDSLLVDIITYVYKKAPNADAQTRFRPEYRGYYVQQLPQFTFLFYHINGKGQHFYYVLRPARSNKGNQRGVGGTFRIRTDSTGNKQITGFRELFNTVVLDTDSLSILGKRIFAYMAENGHADPFIHNPKWVEWPQQQVVYDTCNYEWRYEPGR